MKKNKIVNLIFKRLFLIVYVLLMTVLTGCFDNPVIDPVTDDKQDGVYTIYTINDFHGCIFENGKQAGISKIGKFLHDEKEENPDRTIILSAGDMFQGTLVSSITRGEAVLKCMNYIGFDAMTIGNHEWDWGIDVVLKYQDGDLSNGEADFPFLASNVKYIPTGTLASWATPYTIIERGGYRFGIIGTIGEDETNDILATYVEDYEFTNEFAAIKKYTKILREEEKVDFVIVVSHNDTSSINTALTSNTGEYKIDAIINGHTHQAYYGILNNGDHLGGVPYIQSGCYGAYVGKITLEIMQNEIIRCDAININASSRLKEKSPEIDEIINSYSKEIALANEELGISGEEIKRDEFGPFAANSLLGIEGAEIGVCNSGGIRSNGFPIYSNQMITYGDVFEIIPFENLVAVSSIKGSELIKLMDYSGLLFSNNVKNGKINGKEIDPDKYYRVATNDYLFTKNNYPFKYGLDPIITDILFRDVVKDKIIEVATEYGKIYCNK